LSYQALFIVDILDQLAGAVSVDKFQETGTGKRSVEFTADGSILTNYTFDYVFEGTSNVDGTFCNGTTTSLLEFGGNITEISASEA